MSRESNATIVGTGLTIGLIIYGVFRLMNAMSVIMVSTMPGFAIDVYGEFENIHVMDASDTYHNFIITNNTLNYENITIKVRNKETGEPISRVRVVIHWNHKGGPSTTIIDSSTTNSDGIVTFSKRVAWESSGKDEPTYINGVPYEPVKYQDREVESIYIYPQKTGYKSGSFSLRIPREPYTIMDANVTIYTNNPRTPYQMR